MNPFDETSTQSPCDGCQVLTDNEDLAEFEHKHYCPDCEENRKMEAKKFMELYLERNRLRNRIRVVKYGDDHDLYMRMRSEVKELTKKLKEYV